MQGCSCDGVNVTRGVEKLRGRFGAAISVLPSMLLPFIVPNRVHYGALADYHSYDLAWLGPIAFPLLCAICAQGFIYADMLREKRKGNGARGKEPSSAVDAAVLTIMAAESIFGVLCIIQCVVNWYNRAFVGGARLCDTQAVYASYYVFAGMSLATYGVVIGSVVRVKGTVSLSTVIRAGAGIHASALLFALLPFYSQAEFLFAKDFCMMDLETPTLARLALGYYIGCLAAMVAALKWGSSHAAAARNRSLALYGATAWFAVAWASVVAVCVLALANGSVYDTPQNGAYAIMGMLLHTNQLIVPLLFGYVWRHDMHATVAAATSQNGLCKVLVGHD